MAEIDSRQLAVRIPARLGPAVAACAEQTGRSVADVVRDAVAAYVGLIDGPAVLSADPLVVVDAAGGPRSRTEWVQLARAALGWPTVPPA
jgi:hypothetical protein